MIFGKLIDGKLNRYSPPIKTDGEDIYSTDKDVLLEYGWKEVIFTDAPETGDDEFASAYWEETSELIIQKWETISL